MAIFLSDPELQVNFAVTLIQIRDTLLQDALFATVKSLVLSDVDRDLSMFARTENLSLLASKGLRGEIVFATPIILKSNPYLLGYYRLLLGYSQKYFVTVHLPLLDFLWVGNRGTLRAFLHFAAHPVDLLVVGPCT